VKPKILRLIGMVDVLTYSDNNKENNEKVQMEHTRPLGHH
jgi:hypothetical protein